MAAASIMFVGGAIDPKVKKTAREDEGADETQHRMYQSVIADMKTVVDFAARGSVKTGRTFRHRTALKAILLNKDIQEESVRDTANLLEQKQAHAQHDMFTKKTKHVGYSDAFEVREKIRDFFANDENKNLMLFLSGHGHRHLEGASQESFLVPLSGVDDVARYTDTQLTEDIRECLPENKTLCLVFHACHSGGMMNSWMLNAREKSVALFASAEADILARWNVNSEGFMQVFCEKARPNKQLGTIAQEVLLAMFNVKEHVRPAFVTTRPDMAVVPFLAR